MMSGALQGQGPVDQSHEFAGAGADAVSPHVGKAERGGKVDHVHGPSVPCARRAVSIQESRL